MKTLTEPVITLDGDKITIVATIKDLRFNRLLITRVSHGYNHPDHYPHHRRFQSSNEAVFLESRFGKLAIPNDVLAAIGAHAAPETSFAPVFTQDSKPGNVGTVSETPVSYQWQVSDDAFPIADKPHTPPPPAIWTDIAGATSPTLAEDAMKVGQWIRVIATNLTGKTISKPAKRE